MGVKCQILVNKTKEGVHRPGQAVTGKVKYVVNEATEYKHVTLSLQGKAKFVWYRGTGKSRRSYHGTETYFKTPVDVCNKKNQDDIVTLAGEYEHPFEFYLPEIIPRSYKDRYGAIAYRVKLKFEKPSFFSFNTVFTTEIPVYSYLQVTEVEGPKTFELKKSLCSLFSAKKSIITLMGEIEKTHFSPGENIHLSYVVTNNSDVEVPSVRTELNCRTIYTSNCSRKKKELDFIEGCTTQSEPVPPRSQRSFTCSIPTLPELYSIQHSKVISKEYYVRVTLRVPFPHFNACLKLPVLIGELKRDVDLEDTAEPPPSYWEAMNEKEKKNTK